MAKLGAYIYKHSGWILAGSLIFIVISVVYGTTLFSKLNSSGFQVEGSDSFSAFEATQQQLPESDPEVIVLFSSNDGKKATDPVEKAVNQTLSRLKNNPSIENITSYYNSKSSSLLSRDHTKTFATINIKGDRNEQSKAFPGLRKKLTRAHSVPARSRL